MPVAPIFILGNPRSGTTLLRLMLTCHRDLVIPPECGFAIWLYGKYHDWNRDTHLEIKRYVRDVMQCRKIETWGMREDQLRDFMLDRNPTSYPEAAALVYEWYAISRGEHFKRWGDKNNFYIHHIPTIHKLYPDAVFVHIIRDCRNVACSYKKLHEVKTNSPYAPDLPVKVMEIARQWTDNNDRIRRDLRDIATERVVELRFEDLIKKPERQLRSLCMALGEEYDASMLDYHRTNRERQLEPSELLAWKQKTLQPILATEVDRYKRELGETEITTIESVAGDTLRRYGFLA